MAAILDSIDFSVWEKENSRQNIKEAGSYVESLKDRLRTKLRQKVTYLPWKGSEKNFEYRKGEVSIYSGQNGHGKSLLTSLVALSLMGQGEKVAIASFEMKPVTSLQRMARMWIGVNPYIDDYQGEDGLKALDGLYDEFSGWTDGKLWFYDQNGTTEPEIVIGMVRYCAKELGINHIFIDNLAKVVHSEDDYNGQKNFIDVMTSIARDYGVHIHIVHHLKKPQNEYQMPDKHDNKGSGAITDLVDNVFLVWRNKAKEHGIKTDLIADQYFLCRKQRNYEGSDQDEFTIPLWFNRDSQQYTGKDQEPLCFWNQWPH